MGDSNRLGDIGETAVMLEAFRKGYSVGQMQQDCAYDLVIDRGNGPERVQVKYRTLRKDKSPRRNNSFDIVLKPTRHANRRKYTSKDFDAFAVYVPSLNQVFWIPSSICDEGVDQVTFRHTPDTNRGHENRQIMTYAEW